MPLGRQAQRWRAVIPQDECGSSQTVNSARPGGAAADPAAKTQRVEKHLETHELMEAEDLYPILGQAKGITSQLPGT